MQSTKETFYLPDSTNAEQTFTSKAYIIGGVPIIFPYRAYPTQIAMMDKIIKCLNKKLNCLLESPTGTGKSLALLCACLGWQRTMKKRLAEKTQVTVTIPDECVTKTDFTTPLVDQFNIQTSENGKIFGVDCCSEVSAKKTKFKSLVSKWKFCKKESSKGEEIFMDSPSSEAECDVPISKHSKRSTVIRIDSPQAKSECSGKDIPKRGIFEMDDLEDFQPVKKYCSSVKSPDAPVLQNDQCNVRMKPIGKSPGTSSCLNSPSNCKKPEKDTILDSTILTELPIIYYGTRTHKQIEQIIRELKKTPYKDSRMTILSSRERTCIHDEVSRGDNKNEACAELLTAEDGPACKFYKNAKTVSHCDPSELGTAFDLKDFVSACKGVEACPYYSSKELLQRSEIVFCPYSYLIDPLVRKAMMISLKNNIIILDEAHNIEDSARDAASKTITCTQLEACIRNLERVGRSNRSISDSYLYIAHVLTNLNTWLNLIDLNEYLTSTSSCKVWSGGDMIAVFKYVGLGPILFLNFTTEFEKILKQESNAEKKGRNVYVRKLLRSTIFCLEGLIQVLTHLYKDNLVFAPDYRFVVLKSLIAPSGGQALAQNLYEITFNFWCMNPSVAFSYIKRATHSVIVASGTLSPLTSFQSELGMPFQLTLEANHVIPKNHVWVGTVGTGLNNNILKANYRNAATFTFQDEIGCLVFQVCCTIPHGVLCFLPSYSMMDNLVKRWQQTGKWEKLLSRKVVVCEPHRQNEFVEVMNKFYDAIKESESSPQHGINGALFLAVCRGKVSEGLDFADNNARAVITIGIPFPSIKEVQIDLKQKYNDLHTLKKQVMSGKEWYNTQGFRAINQALGRCIRHSTDFGALIIVDDRFQTNNLYPNALSKWIRNKIVHFHTFAEAMSSLSDFAERTGLKKTEEIIF